MKPAVLSLVSLMMVASCDMLRYHPYQEVDLYATPLNMRHRQELEEWAQGRDTLRLAFISDLQRRYDDTADCVKALNRREDIDFVLIGGDITDFGATDEFRWITDVLNQLQKPWLTTIGNHEFLGLGEHNYERIIGPLNFAANLGRLHLVVLNSIWRDSETDVKAPDFYFLNWDIERTQGINREREDSLTHTIVLMHNMPGDEQFDDRKAAQFCEALGHYPGMRQDDPLFSTEDVERMAQGTSTDAKLSADDQRQIVGSHRRAFCLKGHTHRHEICRPFEDETLFYSVDDIHKREILVFTLNPESYAVESIRF